MHNYLLLTLEGRELRGSFEHEILKPAIIRTSQGNVSKLQQLKHEFNMSIRVDMLVFIILTECTNILKTG